MKYMTFNSSCSFAGVANMLERYGVDVEDRDIALGMKLPFLFEKEDGAYLAGPMLQSARWFDLYLRPIGFAMEERAVERGAVAAALAERGCAMLGLRVTPRSKHAVVYEGREGGRLRFLNNKWARSDEPERLDLTEEELLSRLDDTVVLATLRPAPPAGTAFEPLLRRSLEVLELLKGDISAFCTGVRDAASIGAAVDPLFRAILLDGVTMLALCGQDELGAKLRAVQGEFLRIVREARDADLSKDLSLPLLFEAMEGYRLWIARENGLT